MGYAGVSRKDLLPHDSSFLLCHREVPEHHDVVPDALQDLLLGVNAAGQDVHLAAVSSHNHFHVIHLAKH